MSTLLTKVKIKDLTLVVAVVPFFLFGLQLRFHQSTDLFPKFLHTALVINEHLKRVRNSL